MKYLLFLVCFLPQVLFADAVIFSGNDVKALKFNLDLFGRSKLLGLNVDPSAGAGVPAPLGSIGMNVSTGLGYLKTGAGDTAWEQLRSGLVDLTSEVTGILPNGNTTGDSANTPNALVLRDGSGNFFAQDVGLANLTISGDIELTDTQYTNIFVGEQLTNLISTGLTTGGILAIDADPTKFDLSAGSGVIVDHSVSPPTATKVTWSAFDAQTVTNLATQDYTYILINSSGAIVQQATLPTSVERRDNIFVGRIGHPNRTTVTIARSAPDLSTDANGNFYDLVQALSPFNVQGNILSANGANLSINKTSGQIFQKSYGYAVNPKDPNIIDIASATAAQFRRVTQTTIGGSLVTTIDPANYDVAGTITAIPGSSNVATVQRIYLFGSGNIYIQYGQQVYSTLADAIADIPNQQFIINPVTNAGNGILIGYLAVQKGATDLSNTSQARFLQAPQFPGGGAGGSYGGTTTLQQAYNNSSTSPQITVTSTLGAVNVADNATPIAADLFRVTDSAGTTEYFSTNATNNFMSNALGIGTSGGGVTNSSVALEIGGTTRALRLPVLTTTQRNALTALSGMVIYNSTTASHQYYNGTTWLDSVPKQENLIPTASSTLANTAGFLVNTVFLNPASAITLSTTTPITAGVVGGQKLTVCGESNTNTVTIANSGNVVMNGTAVLGQDDCIEFVWKDSTTDYWLERGRNN